MKSAAGETNLLFVIVGHVDARSALMPLRRGCLGLVAVALAEIARPGRPQTPAEF